jgi:hypothetical protein
MNPSSSYPAGFASADFTPDRLLARGPIDARKETLISGENVVRGTVLGKITASGKYNKSLAAAMDGSQTPDVIAAEDKDATGGDKEILVYWIGGFNENALTLGTGHTVASIKEGLRAKGIILINPAVDA